MRYYFDLREGDEITPDEEGLELTDMRRVEEEAARSLADLARDVVRNHRTDGPGKPLAIQVRDREGPVLQVKFTFEVSRKQNRGPRCPICAAFPRLSGAFLDSVRGRSIQLYECEKCGERIWGD